MPVTVVVGGQFGSEGKGKVAHHLAHEMKAAAAVRVGGPNSGHTVIAPSGKVVVFRQLPTAALLPGVHCLIAPGGYLDVEVLLREIDLADLSSDRISVDPHAMIISASDRHSERHSQLRERIGSTLSGTGAAVQRRIARDGTAVLAKDDKRLDAYVRPAIPLLRDFLDRGWRVVIEGTQGFGLSLLHGPEYPRVTSRDTTAAAFLSEAGLSPIDADDIVLVLRAFPIRVPGNSGFLPREIDWETVTVESGSQTSLTEYTSVTNRIRRVARFDPDVVRRAITTNRPTRIVLNHLDHIDFAVRESGVATEKVKRFVRGVELELGRQIDYYGFGPSILVPKLLAEIRIGKPLIGAEL